MAETAMPEIDRGMKGIFRDAGTLLRKELGPVKGTYFQERYFSLRGYEAIEVAASDQGDWEIHDYGVDRTTVDGNIWVPKPKTSRVPALYAAELGISHILVRTAETANTTIDDEYGIKIVYKDGRKVMQTEHTVRGTVDIPDEHEGSLVAQQIVELKDTSPVRSRSEVVNFLKLAISNAALALTDRPAHMADLQDNYPALNVRR